MGNSPSYVGFLDPPYAVTLTDDTGAALDLTGCTSSSFTLTMINVATGKALTGAGVGVWTVANQITNKGQVSYQWTLADMSTVGSWLLYTTVKLPAEPSPREFDPELIEILAGTVGAGAAPPGVLPAPIAAALYFNVRDYGATPGSIASINTAAILNAWAALKSAGGGVLYFPGPGQYQTADLVFQSFSNFTLKGDRGTSISSSPATAASPGQACHDVCIVADCTDFSVEGLTFDGQRDVIAADQFLTQNAASGQNQVQIQDGTKYVVGEAVWLMGGLTANGGTEKTQNQSNLIITAIAGNILTLNSNLSNSYTATGATGGAWLTQYQTGGVVPYIIAGRSLGNEDAQNGLHLINCQRFRTENVNGQNTWESPIKLGTGFAPTAPTDGCSSGLIMGCNGKHGYDQGISIWNSQYITVLGGGGTDAGWAGVSLSHCSDCDVIGPVCTNNVYSPPFDLNEGSGVAMEGCVRCVVDSAVCSGNNSNGIRLNISPMYGGAALSQAVSGAPAAGATSITLTGANAAFVNGGSYTIVDSANNMIRETIYCTGAVGATVSISPGLRNSYASGPTIFARFGEDCTVIGNDCSLQALGAGIHADQQINLHVELNDCSKNGFLNGSFQDLQGTYGIHLHSFCQAALVKDNICNFNAQEGIVIDNDNRLASVVDNICNNNGIKGVNQKMGIKLYGLVDGAIMGNKCNFNTHSGIYTQDGTITTSRDSFVDNDCFYNANSGIWFDNGGASLTVRGNKAAFNGDVNCKVLGYKDSIFELNQFYNSQGQEGLRFDDGTNARFCTDNKVFDNELFDDQGSPTQSWGFRELNGSARTIIKDNRCYGNTNAAQISKASTSTPCNITAPSVPASTVAYTNTTTYDCTVVITGGTVTVISVGGVATGLTSGTVRVPVGQTIAITYSVVPTWKWFAE